MSGLLDFITRINSPRNITQMSGNYTMLANDEVINFTGASAYTLTLLDLNSMDGTFVKNKVIIQNNATATLTVAVPTTSPIQTVDGSTSIDVPPGFTIVLSAMIGASNWVVDNGSPLPVDLYNVITLVKTFGAASGSQNLFNTSVAPINGQILTASVISYDITASNVTIINNGNTSTTIAKSTTAGNDIYGALSYPNITAGTVVTVGNSGAAACAVKVCIGVQQVGI